MNRRLVLSLLVVLTSAVGARAQTFTKLVHTQRATGVSAGSLDGGTSLEYLKTGNTSNGYGAGVFVGQDNAYINIDGEKHLGAIYTWDMVDIGSDDPALPPRISDLMFGAGARLYNDAQHQVDLIAGAGYAGLHPFTGSEGLYGLATLTYSAGPDADWVVLASYDGNRAWAPDTPIPGVAHRVPLGANGHAWAGFPFGWGEVRPADGWRFVAEYDLGRLNALGTLSYDFNEQWSAYGLVGTKLIAGYDEDADGSARAFYRQHRVEAGLRWKIPFPKFANDKGVVPFMDLKAGVGYAFGQEFQFGDTIDTAGSGVGLSDEPYFRFVIGGGF